MTKTKVIFSGTLKDHLTKYEHAVFYNTQGHDEKSDLDLHNRTRASLTHSGHVGSHALTTNRLAQRNL